MINSKILGKSYKTKASYKTQITKYKRLIQGELSNIKAAKEKGCKLYLGERIDPVINHYELELLRIEKEKKINL